jgi:hypothetical protein
MENKRIHELHKTHLKVLKERSELMPERFPWVTEEKSLEAFAENLMHAIAAGNYTFTGNDTLRIACKQLGIKPMQKALNEWLQG